MPKPRIGDVVEIKTSKGLAYAQVTHTHNTHGTLLRVLPSFFDGQPADLAQIVDQLEMFVAFVELTIPIKKGSMAVVANLPVPVWAQKFPTFRSGMPNPKTNKVEVWWLWNGEKHWRIGKLTDEQRKLPIGGIWGDEFFIDRLESGWRPDPTHDRAV